MERRWSERVPVYTDVVMYCHGESVPGKIKDMNLEGIFVETAGPPCKDEHMQIELRGEDVTESIRVPGSAVHCTENGVGLQLQFDDQETFRRIRDMWVRREAELHPDSR